MFGTLAQNELLLNAIAAGIEQMQGIDAALCVPFPYLAQAQQLLRDTKVKWGAEDVHQLEKGAFTGEVSASMLADFGCSFALVGHSERRSLYGESSHLIAEKFAIAQRQGLLPILCIGETLAQRESGAAEVAVAEQLDEVIKLLGAHSLGDAVIAYEPVWAIGTGKTASPQQAQEEHAFIRRRISEHDKQVAEGVRILYGGSVKASNSAELFAMPDIDGGLIGGASLVADDFLAICKAASKQRCDSMCGEVPR